MTKARSKRPDGLVALDTSVAIPLLVRDHQAHLLVSDWWAARPLTLSGHALAETYAVLTRLPGSLRLAPGDAARLLEQRFEPPLTLGFDAQRDLPATLAGHAITGGAVYDALVALAAVAGACPLATRDLRARGTYQAIGAHVLVVAGAAE